MRFGRHGQQLADLGVRMNPRRQRQIDRSRLGCRQLLGPQSVIQMVQIERLDRTEAVEMGQVLPRISFRCLHPDAHFATESQHVMTYLDEAVVAPRVAPTFDPTDATRQLSQSRGFVAPDIPVARHPG